MQKIKLSNLISPDFYKVHNNVQNHVNTHYILNGGRGSCKSSFVALEVVMLLKKNPNCHALILRKVGKTLRDSVFGQYLWAVEMLGVEREFVVHLQPLELRYIPTGQRILFRGADDKDKIKSLKLNFGYIGITHFEEKDQFNNRAEIRSILQTTMRGGDLFWNFETCNPPASARHWANVDSLKVSKGRLVHHSDYRKVPKTWLGGQFFLEAEQLKQENELAYEHEYLGRCGALGDNVFANVEIRKISSEEKSQFDRLYCGLDWGYFPDPFASNMMHYDMARRTLYIYDEVHLHRASNTESAKIVEKMAGEKQLMYADSAEPKSIADYRASGLLCKPVHKGAGSVAYSMKWLSALHKIVIDPEICPHTAKEFTAYEYSKDKDGVLICGYPDENNHHIDAVRYGLYPVWRRRGE